MRSVPGWQRLNSLHAIDLHPLPRPTFLKLYVEHLQLQGQSVQVAEPGGRRPGACMQRGRGSARGDRRWQTFASVSARARERG